MAKICDNLVKCGKLHKVASYPGMSLRLSESCLVLKCLNLSFYRFSITLLEHRWSQSAYFLFYNSIFFTSLFWYLISKKNPDFLRLAILLNLASIGFDIILMHQLVGVTL